MGVETALAIGAGSQLVGAGLQYGENRAARKRSNQLEQKATGITEAPLDSTASINQQLNTGQDSFLQFLRSDPSALKPFQFDASQAFKDLQANDAINIGDQANQLRSGAGSLGQRFGSGFASQEAKLRARFAATTAARNADISQSSFNTALTSGMSDFNSSRNNKLQLLQLLQGGELGKRQQQLAALGFGAGLPQPGAGALVGQTGSDISSLMMLMNYFNKSGAGAARTSIPSSTTNYFPQMGLPS